MGKDKELKQKWSNLKKIIISGYKILHINKLIIKVTDSLQVCNVDIYHYSL